MIQMVLRVSGLARDQGGGSPAGGNATIPSKGGARMESWWPVARGGELVGYLTDDELARLLKLAESCSAAAGDLVFQKGGPSRSLLIVAEGQLEVFDESMGLPVVLAVVGPGGVVGEVGFVDGLPRTHNVRARGACRLWRLSREALLGL